MDDGTEKHLAISYYGGFFKILDKPGYFQMERESREFFQEKIKSILADNFIPARKKFFRYRRVEVGVKQKPKEPSN